MQSLHSSGHSGVTDNASNSGRAPPRRDFDFFFLLAELRLLKRIPHLSLYGC
ncbi:hypothetical protein ABZ580_01405 [Streptomyces sp. NPDC012486]|uniref:hypothetical protein n=1 Tax=unclassified Streptomyces TaxID=2593676 RepID=UPI0002C6B7AE|nr:hypothetical protein F750_2677 [Streptomyces sp. PAMC 26508]